MAFSKMKDLASPHKKIKPNSFEAVKDLVGVSGFTSYDVFMHFVTNCFSNGKSFCDASKIVGKECYLTWLSTRRKTSVFPPDVFRRTVIAHLTGTKKRKPFPKEVEESLLKTVRLRRVWPCFQDVFDNKGNPVTFGHVGFRPRGYHENIQAGLEPLFKSISVPVLFDRGELHEPIRELSIFSEDMDYDLHEMTFDGEEAGDFGFDMPEMYFTPHEEEPVSNEKLRRSLQSTGLEIAPSCIPRDEMTMMSFFFDLPRANP
uniref:Uncharacterized protein n=1 Tax=Mucochytrium quahogii TaxID=96639 RepID=A0A7S2WFT4_9STRA|mmetsp:Transcript_22581/g.49074  ORF Transcript_22581/g.49074 Transcript_22581/m.49074 type:complete len:259 (+) Transcript_22581:36-812(+)